MVNWDSFQENKTGSVLVEPISVIHYINKRKKEIICSSQKMRKKVFDKIQYPFVS